MATRASFLLGEAVVIGLGDTLPEPVIQLLDGNKEVIDDLSGHTATMEFYDVSGDSFSESGVVDDAADIISFPLTPANVAAATYRHTYVQITNGDGTYSLPAPPFAVVDYAALWADPTTVVGIVGSDYENAQIVLAILAAESAVRAWVTTPIASPVSERVRRATALLASRALTTLPTAEQIEYEVIGDYTVRYADPTGSGLIIDGEIADLLSPWRQGKSYSTYVGPDDIEGPTEFTDLWVNT
jgi:hypothetical protein